MFWREEEKDTQSIKYWLFVVERIDAKLAQNYLKTTIKKFWLNLDSLKSNYEQDQFWWFMILHNDILATDFALDK